LDYLIGYLFRIHVQEVLKPDGRVRANQTIEVLAPFRLEGGVSLPPEKRFLLALAGNIPTGGAPSPGDTQTPPSVVAPIILTIISLTR
jgi:hypothetical protein